MKQVSALHEKKADSKIHIPPEKVTPTTHFRYYHGR
jgi:hypothetical protein